MLLLLFPSFWFSLLFFPGVILHEYFHKLACNLQNVKVYEVKYLVFNSEEFFKDRMGYVVHADCSFKKQILIGLAPFMGFPIGLLLIYFGFFLNSSFLSLFLVWLGFSFALNSFPSKPDVDFYFSRRNSRKRKSEFLMLIMGFFYLVALLEVIAVSFFITGFLTLTIYNFVGLDPYNSVYLAYREIGDQILIFLDSL